MSQTSLEGLRASWYSTGVGCVQKGELDGTSDVKMDGTFLECWEITF